MGENGEAFREMQDIYNEAMEMIDHDFENMLGDDYCGGVSDDEVENAVAAENNRIVSAVMKTAVQAVGKCINDTVAAYDGGDDVLYHTGYDRANAGTGRNHKYHENHRRTWYRRDS